MRLVFILFLALSPILSTAQANFVYAGYTQCTWNEITLMDSTYSSSDSSILFVTTRSFNPGQGKAFLGNEIASDSLLRFFTVYFRGNNWKAVPRKNFDLGLDVAGGSSDFVIYSEGDGKSFPDNVDRSTRLSRLYQTNVIMFDWPSRVPGYGGIKNVRNTVHNTRNLGKQYHNLLLLLKAYKVRHPEKPAHVTLFFHSMGNAVFQNSVEKYGTADLGQSLVDNVVMNAACVRSRSHRKWVESLHIQNHIYIVYNRKDKTLREASLLFAQKLVGCKPGRHLAKNAVYLNIHELAGDNHNYFLIIPLLVQHRGIGNFYNSVFHARPLNLQAQDYFRISKHKAGYTLIN